MTLLSLLSTSARVGLVLVFFNSASAKAFALPTFAEWLEGRLSCKPRTAQLLAVGVVGARLVRRHA